MNFKVSYLLRKICPQNIGFIYFFKSKRLRLPKLTFQAIFNFAFLNDVNSVRLIDE